MTRTYLGSSGYKRHYRELRRKKRKKINIKLLFIAVFVAVMAVGLRSCTTEYEKSVDVSAKVRELDSLSSSYASVVWEQDEEESFILEAPPPGRARTEAEILADYK